eukprot:1189225-Prorocentrum_minimum.AAC.2
MERARTISIGERRAVGVVVATRARLLLGSYATLTRFLRDSFSVLTRLLLGSYATLSRFLRDSYSVLTRLLLDSYATLTRFLRDSYSVRLFRARNSSCAGSGEGARDHNPEPKPSANNLGRIELSGGEAAEQGLRRLDLTKESDLAPLVPKSGFRGRVLGDKYLAFDPNGPVRAAQEDASLLVAQGNAHANAADAEEAAAAAAAHANNNANSARGGAVPMTTEGGDERAPRLALQAGQSHSPFVRRQSHGSGIGSRVGSSTGLAGSVGGGSNGDPVVRATNTMTDTSPPEPL